jgi:hypothetical protein
MKQDTFRAITIWLIILAVALASGCAGVPMADSRLDASAKTFAIPRDKAGVYIYRNESFGAAVKMDVYLNGAHLGETGAQTYIYTEVEPGTHTVMGKSENENSVRFHALAGKLYYIWQEVKMGLLYARNELKLVDDQTGRAGVMESKLIAGPAK